MDAALAGFGSEGQRLVEVVRTLSVDDHARPTNCPPWTLSELVVHIAGSVRAGDFRDATAGAGLRSAADYYRRPERDTAEYREHNVRVAQRQAQQVLRRTTIADCLTAALRDTSAVMTDDDLERIVAIDRVGAMRLGDWLATRVVALAAHGLDVAVSLELPAWTTPAALAVTRPILESLLGSATPAGWSDQRLLEVSTGRSALTERDRTQLGPAADRFPLLS